MYKNLCFDQALSPYVVELRDCYVSSKAGVCVYNTVLRIGGEGRPSVYNGTCISETARGLLLITEQKAEECMPACLPACMCAWHVSMHEIWVH